MARDNCGDCANLGEQLDQCEEDAEEFCQRIAQLEAEIELRDMGVEEEFSQRIADLEAELERTRQAWADGEDAMCEDVCQVACKGPCGGAIDVVKDGTIAYAEGHGPTDPPRPVLHPAAGGGPHAE